MTTAQRVLAALAVALATLLLLPSAATAASNDVIRDLRIEIDIRPDGVLEVTETYDWDFGTRQGLGLTRELDARFDYDDEHVRLYEYDNFAVTSPTNAPAGVWPRTSGPKVIVDIGAPDGSDDRRTGRQTYVLTYTVTGALNAIRGQEGLEDRDELYWNATGHNWQIPIEHASVTVRGPADLIDHACYQGDYGATDHCTTQTATDGQVQVTSGRLDPGTGVTVMAAYPPGTFEETDPILRERPSGGIVPGPFGQEPAAVAAVGDFVRGNALWLAPVGVALPAAYAFSRYRFLGDKHMFFWLLTNRMAPPAVFALPFFNLYSAIGLFDTPLAVALAHCLFNVPLAVWILEGFMSGVPREIDETAYIDGYSFPKFFVKIFMPLIASGIGVACFFTFMFSWVELLIARTLTTTDAKPIAAIMTRTVSASGLDWGVLAAAGVPAS